MTERGQCCGLTCAQCASVDHSIGNSLTDVRRELDNTRFDVVLNATFDQRFLHVHAEIRILDVRLIQRNLSRNIGYIGLVACYVKAC